MQTILMLLLMTCGAHGVNIFDQTPYTDQVKRPNCIIVNGRVNPDTGTWEYGPYKYCVKNGHWTLYPQADCNSRHPDKKNH